MGIHSEAQSYLRLRARMIVIGVWSGYLVLLPALAWTALSWEQPNRMAILGVVFCALAGTMALHLQDADQLVRSRHCESFFLAWSLADIVLIAVTAALDGGAASPAVGAFFCTAVFPALSYPLRSVAIIGAFNVAALVAASTVGGVVSPETGGAYLFFLAVCLAVVGAMCVWQARLQEEHRAQLARLSSADPLTGALNRRGFGERLELALAAAAAHDGSELALLVLDLDRFKALNDAHGHEAGDALLRDLVAQALTTVRAQDAVGRLGGDEFAVLLPGSDAARAQGVAERIADALPAQVGVSYGIACLPHDGTTGEELHRRADERLYAFKRAGREPVPA